MTVAALLYGRNTGHPMLVASSTIVKQYRAPPVDVGIGSARSAYRRCIRFSSRHNVDLATAFQIAFPPTHPSQYYTSRPFDAHLTSRLTQSGIVGVAKGTVQVIDVYLSLPTRP